jgi:hypothetical protein
MMGMGRTDELTHQYHVEQESLENISTVDEQCKLDQTVS